MAYLSSSLTNLTLEMSHIHCVHMSGPFPASNPFPVNLSFSGTKSAAQWLRTSTLIRNSSHPEAFSEPAWITHIPLLSLPEAIDRLKSNQGRFKGKQQYLAMYSSIFEGITTDTAAMVIPMDDHMVHRGHGVFDTAAIMDGYFCGYYLSLFAIFFLIFAYVNPFSIQLISITVSTEKINKFLRVYYELLPLHIYLRHLYELDQHLDRFIGSATMAKIKLPFDRESIRRILIQTVSASKCRRGSLRYWLSGGPGDFNLSPSGCHHPALYAIVIQDQSPPDFKGLKVTTSSIPIKPPQFAVMKSVNYLPNVLSKMEAEEKGGYAAIWLDEDGYVAEGPNMNVGFVTNDNELLMPHFDKILSGCTARRVLILAEGLVKEGKLKGIRAGNVTVEEGKNAKEMMLIGSGVLVRPVVQWDDQLIGNGKEGMVAEALLNLILEDMKSGPSSVRVPVPY